MDRDYAGAVPNISGVVHNDLPPVIGLQDFSGMGCGSGTAKPGRRISGNALLSWVKGRHKLESGAHIDSPGQHNPVRKQAGELQLQPTRYGIAGRRSGNSGASFLLGAVNSGALPSESRDQTRSLPCTAIYFGDT